MEPIQQSESAAVPVVAKAIWPSSYSLLKQSFVFYKGHAKKFFLLGMVPFVISLVASVIALSDKGEPSIQTAVVVGLLAILGIIGTVVGIASQMAIIKSIEVFDKNETVAVKEAYVFGFKLFLSTVWAGILTVFVVGGGLVALIIPGIIIAFYVSFNYYTIALEQKRGLGALAQSWIYVKGNGFEVFKKSFYIGLAAFAVAVIVIGLMMLVSLTITGDTKAALDIISDKTPLSNSKIVYGILSDLVTYAVLMPITFSFYYFVYKHIRSLRQTVVISEAEVSETKKVIRAWCIVAIAFVVLMGMFLLWGFTLIE